MSNYFDRLLLLGRIACIAWMRPVATCVLRSVTCVSVSVLDCLFVCVFTSVSPAKTDEPIVMPFGGGGTD